MHRFTDRNRKSDDRIVRIHKGTFAARTTEYYVSETNRDNPVLVTQGLGPWETRFSNASEKRLRSQSVFHVCKGRVAAARTTVTFFSLGKTHIHPDPLI